MQKNSNNYEKENVVEERSIISSENKIVKNVY